jgi:protein phosphatase
VLERAVGSKPGVEVDISDKLKLFDGDAILLCSDGLSGYVADPEIEKVLRSPASVQEIPA